MKIYFSYTNAKNGGYGVIGKGIERELVRAGHVLTEDNPDIVITYGVPNVALDARKKFPNKKMIYYVVWESSKYPDTWESTLKESKPDLVLTATKYTKWVLSRSGIDSEVWNHGIDDRWKYKPRRDDGIFTFLHYNAYEWRKGWEIVLGAFLEEFKESDKVQLILKARERDNADYLIPAGMSKESPLPFRNVKELLGHLTDEEMTEMLEVADCGVFPCFTPDNEILTTDGFKSYEDIKEGDEVWSFNDTTGEIEKDRINKVILQNYDDDIVEFNNKVLNLSVTKNHRMYYKTLKSKNWKIDRADFFTKDSKTLYRLPISFEYKGKRDRYIDTTRWLKGVTNKMHKLPEKILVSDLLYVMGWYISEGSFGKGYDVNRIDIAQSKHRQSRLKKLVRILKGWGLSPTICKDKVSFGSGHITNILKECGEGAVKKRIPSWVFDYDKKSLKSLYESMMLGDGTQGGHHESYYTISEQLRDDFQLLCLLLGYSTSYVHRHHARRKIENHWVEESYDYMIDIRKERLTGYFRANQANTKHYKGVVWCVQTNNETVITRKGGEIVASGNCRGEGWFLPATECVAQGIPVIMPNYMGMSEQWGVGYLDCGIDGYINASPRYPGYMIMPSVNGVREKMRWCYEHQEECRKLGKDGSKEVYKKFNWCKIIKELEKYINLTLCNDDNKE